MATGTNASVAGPRFIQQYVRRVDVTAGGVQVGLGSLNDYGSLAGLLLLNTLGKDKVNELGKYEGGDAQYTGSADGYTGTPGAVALAANMTGTQTPATKKQCTSWLGLLGGSFMRFLDTNLLPDIEIRLTLAGTNILSPSIVTANSPVSAVPTGVTYSWTANSVTFETIAFGDDSYRQMIDARLASGEPIVIPFTNWASYESSASSGVSSQTQFTVATQSLNGLLGSARGGGYDSNLYPSVSGLSTEYFAFGGGKVQAQGWLLDGTAAAPTVAPNTTFQFNIDSKVYPQFLADADDAYMLTKNFFDGAGLNRDFASHITSVQDWRLYAFAVGIGLDHHSEQMIKDRMISGLNTNGSSIPITFTINSPKTSTNTNGYRPIVFAQMTSTLMVYAGRVISVIN